MVKSADLATEMTERKAEEVMRTPLLKRTRRKKMTMMTRTPFTSTTHL